MDAESKPSKLPRAENTALLAEIGARVRNERAKRGMTRRALAGQCQTSERYLAQIEAGAGNPSVLVLDAIARALDLDPIDLLPGGSALRALRRLPPAQLTALMHATETRQRPRAVANRARRIALIGLRGAGKSTLGSALAERIDAPFVEIDQMIEQRHGAPLATLFEVYGQSHVPPLRARLRDRGADQLRERRDRDRRRRGRRRGDVRASCWRRRTSSGCRPRPPSTCAA